jgi:tripartite-type tricarboxylate transporter receptor subunit TctC
MRRLVLGLVMLAAFVVTAAAQGYPQRLVRVIVPFPAGGSYDVLARMIAQKLSDKWGQQVVIENRSGGNGEVGTGYVAGSAPDGYTLLFWGDGVLITQWMNKGRTFNVLQAFAPVSLVARTSQLVVANPQLPAKTLRDLIALGKDGRTDVRYATAGPGTPGHLAVELLMAKTGAKFRHIPYRGGALALTDVLSGQVELVSTGLPALISTVRAGKIVPIAVTTEKRSPALPDVPSMNELSPGVFVDTWYGFLAPADLPDAIAQKIHADVSAVTRSPDIMARLDEQGFEFVGEGPAQLRALMQRDLPRYQEILSIAGVSAE